MKRKTIKRVRRSKVKPLLLFSLYFGILALTVYFLSDIIGVRMFQADAQAAPTFTPVADSYVDQAAPTINKGTSTQFRADGSPVVESYLRFNVQGLTGSVSQAILRVRANSSHTAGYTIHQVSDNTWGETTINYNNKPSYSATVAGSSGTLVAGTSYDVNVTPLITGNGLFSFVLRTTSSTAMSLASRESATTPLLLITTTGSTEPTPTQSVPTPTSIVPTTVVPTPTETVPTPTTVVPTPPTGSAPFIMAASDIICDSLTTTTGGCQQMAASNVAVAQDPTAMLIVGDLCHTPSANCFNNYYQPSWGRLFAKTYPATGNHEYLVSGAVYYFDYWNGAGNQTGRAGDRSKAYYSFDIGDWHFVALNSQCSQAGGCGTTSPQYAWLQQDLQSHPNQCTLAFYHIPVFSSGGRANNNMRSIFTLLYNNNVDVVLNGHDHIYERFAPQNPSGGADSSRGIREFIVGTGGANHTKIATVQPNSEVRNVDTFGALKITLHPDRYDWNFMPVAGKTFTDSGSTLCH